METVELLRFRPFLGQHCEAVATGNLLRHLQIELSEPMLFGLGEGLSFIFINLASLPLPFVGGRVKPFVLTETLCKNLNLTLLMSETASPSKAWQLIEKPLCAGSPVGLQLDSYYLGYFSKRVHFAGHCIAAYGFDQRDILVVDTLQQGGPQRVSRKDVEAARFARGPMSARARSWTISDDNSRVDIVLAAKRAIRANATTYLSPAFKGATFLGIDKLAKSLPKWMSMANDPSQDLALASLLMERAGTGGSLFRNFYRDFLEEVASEDSNNSARLWKARNLFADSAQLWTSVAANLDESGRTNNSKPLEDAAAACNRIKELEISAMKLLSAL